MAALLDERKGTDSMNGGSVLNPHPSARTATVPTPICDASPRVLGTIACSQVSIDMCAPQAPPHIIGSTLAPLSRRPDAELFHCMVSYRVKTDAARACAIHDGLHFKALNAKAKLDFYSIAKYPAGFTRAREAKQSWVNIFVDKFCLQHGKDWATDGFLKAILCSLTIVPLLSWETTASPGNAAQADHNGSVGGLAGHCRDSPVDNVLLELLLAKELHAASQALATAANQFDALYPCMHIIPIFVHDLFGQLSLLSDDAPQATLAKAAEVLQSVGVQPDASFMNQSVKEIVSYFTKLQGVKCFEFGVEGNKQAVDHIWRHLKSQATAFDLDRFQLNSFAENSPQGSELLQFLSASDAGYLSRFLVRHGVSSVQMLADIRLHPDVLKTIALEISTQCKRPLVEETIKFGRVVSAAAESHMSRPLCQRLRDFLDTDASILTAIYR